MRTLSLLFASLSSIIIGCSRSEPPAAPSPATSAAESIGPAQASGSGDVATKDPGIAAVLANPARSEADRGRDARDQPEAVLTLAGFGPGMTIADIFGGGGYYSEILSGVVGVEGKVVLINNAAYDAYAKKGLEPRLADGRLPNVEYNIVPNDAMQLGDSTLDGAMIVMSYHDLYVVDPENGWPAIDAGQFLDQIATALKPGGVLLIVDHSAREGSGNSDANSLHRIEESFARADISSHGLELISSSDVLRNPDDPRDKGALDESIRGKTDRFVHVYRKNPDA
ncbi:class I SAM-dependent methyltransferase [Dokdonella sp.]|uniref:class I SAM-dependent methyltransferase n=1 Tax=Dokdonella sp. TaxID=2291710 RepID=UPI003529C9B7